MARGKVHKVAYIAINKESFEVFGSCFKQDLADFVGIDKRTLEKYLEKGVYKGWIFKKVDRFRVKKQ